MDEQLDGFQEAGSGSVTPACEDPLVQVAVAGARRWSERARYLLDTVDAVGRRCSPTAHRRAVDALPSGQHERLHS